MNPVTHRVKQIIEKVTPDSLWITAQSIYSRNRQMNYLRAEGFLDLGRRFVERYGTQVLQGPFAGMNYPFESTVTRHIVPRLLGSYEMELHPVLEKLTRSYDCVVDIGSAEGYYAVGLALRLGVPVYAFEADVRERRRTEKMAAINGVGGLVKVSGFCSRTDLVRLCSGRTFILSDCEGYERVLFDANVIPNLQDADMIIETHGEGTEALLAERLSRTHRVRVLPSRQRSGFEFPELDLFREQSALAACELRPPQSWMWCESMSASKDVSIPAWSAST